MTLPSIRNFCIIAHIDHGKSTLADRMLELTGTVARREMQAQLLDQMELERERGITIKLAPVRMRYRGFELNLIDTPGHVDFSYEVSRSLQAVETAVLVVDATQGIQAQTLANVYLALEQELFIIPVLNKIDLPAADVPGVSAQLVNLLGCTPDEIIGVSAKTGENVEQVLDAIIEKAPPPRHLPPPSSATRALIFDSYFDDYRGVVLYVRVFDGKIAKSAKIGMLGAGTQGLALEVGALTPKMSPQDALAEGEIGYIVTNLKTTGEAKVGDTVAVRAETAPVARTTPTAKTTPEPAPAAKAVSKTTLTAKAVTKPPVPSPASNAKKREKRSEKPSLSPSHGEPTAIPPLPGYREVLPFVYAGFFPVSNEQYQGLKDAVAKLALSDSALRFTPENSPVLGFGLRIGFLGLLHMDIIRERLEREFGLDLVVTNPSTNYQVVLNSGEELEIKSAADLPDQSEVAEIREPWVRGEIVLPKSMIGGTLNLINAKRGRQTNLSYIEDRALIAFEAPMANLLTDFYDQLKSLSSGYASFNYELAGYRAEDLVRVDVLVAGQRIDALAVMCHRSEAETLGREITKKLKAVIPRQNYEVALQAAIGARIIARETIGAYRKDVTVKVHTGDRDRKAKLLEKQKRGKARMKRFGKVDIPAEAFTVMLKRD